MPRKKGYQKKSLEPRQTNHCPIHTWGLGGIHISASLHNWGNKEGPNFTDVKAEALSIGRLSSRAHTNFDERRPHSGKVAKKKISSDGNKERRISSLLSPLKPVDELGCFIYTWARFLIFFFFVFFYFNFSLYGIYLVTAL